MKKLIFAFVAIASLSNNIVAVKNLHHFARQKLGKQWAKIAQENIKLKQELAQTAGQEASAEKHKAWANVCGYSVGGLLIYGIFGGFKK